MTPENNPLKPGDQRPKRGGWAPGNYFCRCNICEDMFTGDKRAIWCADCAYAAPDEELVTPAPNPASDTAREAAEQIARQWCVIISIGRAQEIIQTAIDDSTTALRRDAERYQFLRDRAFLNSPDSRAGFASLEQFTGEAFDQAIDNLMNP